MGANLRQLGEHHRAVCRGSGICDNNSLGSPRKNIAEAAREAARRTLARAEREDIVREIREALNTIRDVKEGHRQQEFKHCLHLYERLTGCLVRVRESRLVADKQQQQPLQSAISQLNVLQASVEQTLVDNEEADIVVWNQTLGIIQERLEAVNAFVRRRGE